MASCKPSTLCSIVERPAEGAGEGAGAGPKPEAVDFVRGRYGCLGLGEYSPCWNPGKAGSGHRRDDDFVRGLPPALAFEERAAAAATGADAVDAVDGRREPYGDEAIDEAGEYASDSRAWLADRVGGGCVMS